MSAVQAASALLGDDRGGHDYQAQFAQSRAALQMIAVSVCKFQLQSHEGLQGSSLSCSTLKKRIVLLNRLLLIHVCCKCSEAAAEAAGRRPCRQSEEVKPRRRMPTTRIQPSGDEGILEMSGASWASNPRSQ